MSIDINWETLTDGPDGASRAESIRAFIHDRFQQVTLPRFIRSVKVHSFDFGSVPPVVELKDICDPLPDFYEEDEDYPDESEGENEGDVAHSHLTTCNPQSLPRNGSKNIEYGKEPSPHDSSQYAQSPPPYVNPRVPGLRTTLAPGEQLGSPLIPRVPTPGIPGGTSNMNYFHLPLGSGLSSTATPLAAVAGAQFQAWPDHQNYGRQHSHNAGLRNATSISSLTPPSTADPGSRPPSQHQHDLPRRSSKAGSDRSSSEEVFGQTPSPSPPPRLREKTVEDLQIVSHVNYSGDIRISLTAEILLDYPMPSFVGIPLKLNITGLTFDGVAILAYIKKRAHFCFLSPGDADALIGGESSVDISRSEIYDSNDKPIIRPKIGGLLEHIKVESEIGEKGSGKQVLKNVGKVESFILEQVRHVFEDEFVYPSFWTFLV